MARNAIRRKMYSSVEAFACTDITDKKASIDIDGSPINKRAHVLSQMAAYALYCQPYERSIWQSRRDAENKFRAKFEECVGLEAGNMAYLQTIQKYISFSMQHVWANKRHKIVKQKNEASLAKRMGRIEEFMSSAIGQTASVIASDGAAVSDEDVADAVIDGIVWSHNDSAAKEDKGFGGFGEGHFGGGGAGNSEGWGEVGDEFDTSSDHASETLRSITLADVMTAGDDDDSSFLDSAGEMLSKLLEGIKDIDFPDLDLD